MSELDISQVFITRKMYIEEEGKGQTYLDEVKRRYDENLCVFCGECVVFQRKFLLIGGALSAPHHEACRRRAWGEVR